MQAQIARGTLREDLDPKLLVLSVVSLAVFPFLAVALTSRLFGVRHDEEFVTRFLAHTQTLLAHGIAPAVGAAASAAAQAAVEPQPNTPPASNVYAVVARAGSRQ